MKILMINSVFGIKSTGRICSDLAVELISRGHTVKVAYGKGNVPEHLKDIAVRIGSDTNVVMQALSSRILDNDGLGNKSATEKFISWVNEYDPDVIHIHNIHSYFLNYPILFDYIKKKQKRVIWTFHDCWAFTGHCCYFDFANCEKWKNQCENCPQKMEYPTSYFMDRSIRNYQIKKKCFTGIENMTIVTPSKWLADIVKQSFLGDNRIIVINNGIDTVVFHQEQSDLRRKLGLIDEKVVLGVASPWHRRKGLTDIIELSKTLPSDYKIVLVGLSDKQIAELPDNIIGIKRTNSTKELGEFYNLASVYINPTYEDNYPTTNIEALSCLTPVVTYRTGGSTESALLFGKVVDKGDISAMCEAIKSYEKFHRTFDDNYIFSKERMFKEYLELYTADEV